MRFAARELWWAGRLLARAPGFTLVAIATLGVAIGACTAMYSVAYGVALQPLPYPDPDRLVHLWQVNQTGERLQFSDLNFEDVRAATHGFTAVAEYGQTTASVVVGTLAMRASVATVSRDFLDTFATEPALGRRFAGAELTEAGAPAALVSHRFWRQHFEGRGDLSNATLRVRGRSHAVVGVLPPRFDFPAGVDIWLPREALARNPYRTGHNWRVVARLSDHVDLAAARTESTTIARRLKAEHGDSTWMSDMAVVPLQDEIVGRVRPVLMLLLASVALLLVVASANLANLLVVRAAGRQRELAVRSALGATGASLMLPLAAESLLLSSAGGVLGLALAYGVLQALALTESLNIPRLADVQLSWPAVTFAIAVTSVTALGLGLLVAWRAHRPDVVAWLKEAQRSHTGGASLRRLRNGVVVAQLAISVVLLVGAGLLGRSLARLLSQDLGFRTDGVLTVDLSTPRPELRATPDALELADPTSLPRQAHLNERLIERLGALPGVIEAGGINAFPLGGRYSNGRFIIVRGDERSQSLGTLGPLFSDASRTGDAEFRVASAGYFRAMGIPLIRGRYFGQQDTAGAPHVALISESLAQTRWPEEDPIGRRIQFGGMDGDLTVFTIVGIVGDIRERALDSEPRPTFYAEYRQRPFSTYDFTVVLRTSIEPTSLVADARRVISEIAPAVPPRFRTATQVVGASTAARRLTFALTGSFAAAAMLLAVLGVYGVLSYLVTQRRHEFGIRLALGARPSQVRGMVLGEAMRLVGIGLALGVGAAVTVRRVLDGMLFGIASTDPVTYVAVTLGLALAGVAASQLPAIRATRVDPMTVLRAE